MGAFFTNYHIRTDDLVAARDAVNALAADSRAYLSPPAGGWVTVYDEHSDNQDDAVLRRTAMGLSRKLATHVIAFLVHDSDILMYVAYGRGQLLDEFNSAPDYFGEDVDDETRARVRGDAAALLPLCPAGTMLEQVEAVLHPAVRDVFAERTLEDLATVLGIDPARASLGFRYFEEDGADALPDHDQFVAAGKTKRRKSAGKGRKATARARRAAAAGVVSDVESAASNEAEPLQLLAVAIGMLCMPWKSSPAFAANPQLLEALGPQAREKMAAQMEAIRAGFDKEAGRMLAASGVTGAPSLAEFVAARDAGPDALAELIAARVPQVAADVAIASAAQGEEPFVRALLARPGLIDPASTYAASGMTLLMAALQGGLSDVAREMMARGADVNATMHGNWTPLHMAARQGGGELVVLLLAAGARTDVKTDQGMTPLMLARAGTEARRLLIEAVAAE
jgi:hypothetical protein